MVRPLRGAWLGRRDYQSTLALQEALFAARQRGEVADTALFVEHDAVVTLGRGAHVENLLLPAVLEARGVPIVAASRGGDVTLHLPGQLVAYPIVDLNPDRRDVRRWVALLCDVMSDVLAPLGVASGRVDGQVGVWVDAAAPGRWRGVESATRPEKIGAVGVRISRWVTMHGFALNLTPELGLYDTIVPCGVRDRGVTSVAALGRLAPAVADAAASAYGALATRLEADAAPLADLAGEPADAVREALLGAP